MDGMEWNGMEWHDMEWKATENYNDGTNSNTNNQ